MELQLKNIGMIKAANVKIDGLTVIAGENDTGKSTVGKMLFALIKSDNIAFKQKASGGDIRHILATRLNLIFDGNISFNGSAKLIEENDKKQPIIDIQIKDKNYVSKVKFNRENTNRFFDATFVQSPLVFDLVDFFNSVSKMRERKKYDYGLDFDISYPYMMWDLYDKLSKDNPFPHAKRQRQIDELITTVISGKLHFDNSKFYYLKRVQNSEMQIEMENTATGIKSFGVIQVLNNNKFFTKKNILILDEPEVHLHPKWQLKMAKLITMLVEKGMTIVVNSHSPYMIEALQRYSELANVNSDFYLAEDGYIKKENNSNSETLSKIFAKLSEPFDVFDAMDSEKLQNG